MRPDGGAAAFDRRAEHGVGRPVLSQDRLRADLTGSARSDPAYGLQGEHLRGSRGDGRAGAPVPARSGRVVRRARPAKPATPVGSRSGRGAAHRDGAGPGARRGTTAPGGVTPVPTACILWPTHVPFRGTAGARGDMLVRHGILRPRIIGTVAIVMVAVLVGIAGYNAYRQAFGTIRAQHSAELQVIGKLKVAQIVDWRNERLSDAHMGAAGAFTGAVVAGWLADPTNAAFRTDVVARLDLFTHQDPGPAAQLSQYDDAILAAPDGHLLLSLDPVATELDPEAQSLAAQVAASREPAMGDFVRVESSGHVYIDVAAPILDASGRPIAVLILRSDPSLHLYPLIQSWPTPSESAETLLIRRDGDSVLYLNVLRHRVDPALTLREPLSSTTTPVVDRSV